MKRSENRILTTHVGSLPRPTSLLDLYASEAPDAQLQQGLKSAVDDVVAQQCDAGIDVIDDGEFGKASRSQVDYSPWWSYAYERLAGYEVVEGRTYGQSFGPVNSEDRSRYRAYYDAGFSTSGRSGAAEQPTGGSRLARLACTGPVKYNGQALIQRDIRNLKDALKDRKYDEAFIPAVSPATLQIVPNQHYKTQDEYTWAVAEAISEEYKAIVDAGFILQIDDPALVVLYDWWFSKQDDFAGYRKWAAFQVEAANHALEGIPEDRIRFHFCWGSWHGPHSTDVPLKDVVDLFVQVKAQGYSIEAGNVRHEHEWKVWQDTKLEDGKVLIPGVVSHATDVLEHPELVADRIVQYANIVGRENVIAGTDCGLGGRIHSQLAWAKLEVLSQGAELATKRLWSK